MNFSPRPLTLTVTMADIFEVCDMITRMVDGFESEVMRCLDENKVIVSDAIREQIYSGLKGDDRLISPTYEDDPYFEQKGKWYHRGEAYKQWKLDITPPTAGTMLALQPRPDYVPNLYIFGTFHDEIFATVKDDTLIVDVDESGHGPDIVAKYGSQLLHLGTTATEYLNNTYIIPHIWKYFTECGY